MKKGLMTLTPLLSLVLPSCGPSEAELRTELHSIDRELMVLRNAAFRIGCGGLQYCISQPEEPFDGACRSNFLGNSGKTKNNKTLTKI